jgi:hypothetical protein
MNRRNFLKTLGTASAAGMLTPQPVGAEGLGMNLKTKHAIVILNGNGCRKKEFYESSDMSPNITGLANEAFVYTEDANNTVSNHGNSWTELLTGNELQSGIPLYPTMPHYIRKHFGDSATNYWFLQGISYYRGWRYNVKYYTSHPQYGIESSDSANAVLGGSPGVVPVAEDFQGVQAARDGVPASGPRHGTRRRGIAPG